jgi:hypothetical protein
VHNIVPTNVGGKFEASFPAGMSEPKRARSVTRFPTCLNEAGGKLQLPELVNTFLVPNEAGTQPIDENVSLLELKQQSSSIFLFQRTNTKQI